MAEDLCDKSATELAALIREKQVSPVEAVDASLARIARIQPDLNAFCFVYEDEARALAREAEADVMRGDALGPLHGVPVAIKDFTPTIAVEPHNAQAYYNRGAAYGNLGRHQRAIEDFDQAIELNPQDAGLYVMRAFAYSALGQHNEAVVDIEHAVGVCESEELRDQLRDLRQRMKRLKR